MEVTEDSLLVYLYSHEHEWIYIGAKLWPDGQWRPVFRCRQCEDTACDLAQNAKK